MEKERRETVRERERERERERDLWEEERLKLVTVRVWGERKKKEERKSEKAYHEREKAQKNMFSMITNEDNIYKRCNAWEREIVFQKIFLENNL